MHHCSLTEANVSDGITKFVTPNETEMSDTCTASEAEVWWQYNPYKFNDMICACDEWEVAFSKTDIDVWNNSDGTSKASCPTIGKYNAESSENKSISTSAAISMNENSPSRDGSWFWVSVRERALTSKDVPITTALEPIRLRFVPGTRSVPLLSASHIDAFNVSSTGVVECVENQTSSEVVFGFPTVVDWGLTCGEAPKHEEGPKCSTLTLSIVETNQSQRKAVLKCPTREKCTVHTISYRGHNGHAETVVSKMIAVCPPGFIDEAKKVVITLDGVLINETSEQDIKNQVTALVDDEVKDQIVSVVIESKDQVYVTNVIVVVADEQAADAVVKVVVSESKKDDCSSGVLCRVATIEIQELNRAVQVAALVPLLLAVLNYLVQQWW